MLSLIETILAMATVLGIAIAIENPMNILIAGCLAPLLLLRSDESTKLAKEWFDCRTQMDPPKKKGSPFVLCYRFAYVLIVSLVVRVLATIRHPVCGVRSIPHNWYRVVLCTDTRCPPELVPESEPVKQLLLRLTDDEDESSWWFHCVLIAFCLGGVQFFAWLASLTKGILFGLACLSVFVFAVNAAVGLLGILCYVTSFLYRFSLKSSALLWLPLIYVVRTTFDESLPLSGRLREITDSALSKIMRSVSWITLALFLSKLILLPNVIGWWNAQQWTKTLNVYVMPNQLHAWHVASAINAFLAISSYYLFVERAERYLSAGAWTEKCVEKWLQIVTFVIGCISIYTIAAGIYLTFVAAIAMEYPSWSGRLLPW